RDQRKEQPRGDESETEDEAKRSPRGTATARLELRRPSLEARPGGNTDAPEEPGPEAAGDPDEEDEGNSEGRRADAIVLLDPVVDRLAEGAGAHDLGDGELGEDEREHRERGPERGRSEEPEGDSRHAPATARESRRLED